MSTSRELYRIAIKRVTEGDLIIFKWKFARMNNIKWNFIPAYSPHHGGLWGVTIKRDKYHLVRVIGTNTPALTFEEISIVFAQIETISTHDLS